MVAPISNDKILPSETTSNNVSEKKKPSPEDSGHVASTQNQTTSSDESSTETSSVDVERANQIYSQSKARLSSGENQITNPEQAKSLAAEIRVPDTDRPGPPSARAGPGGWSHPPGGQLADPGGGAAKPRGDPPMTWAGSGSGPAVWPASPG